jgi:ABC-type transporter Mla subunit MlaD
MDIDARLDRLTERHEALIQTVEIVAAMQHENEKAISRLERAVEKTDNAVGRLVGTVETLVDIVSRHEQRLDDLEK